MSVDVYAIRARAETAETTAGYPVGPFLDALVRSMRDVPDLLAEVEDHRQRLATVRALHPRGPGNLCPRCLVDWPCETAMAVGDE